MNFIKLREVCRLDKRIRTDGLLPYVGMEDIESNTGKFLGSKAPKEVKSSTFEFDERHVLYGRLRPYLNKVLLPDFGGHCSTEIFPLLPTPRLDRGYLFYWFNNHETTQAVNRTCTGARMPRANMKEVLNFSIPLPPLEEQKRIVAILDQAFEGIDKAIAGTEQNLKNARELFEGFMNSIFLKGGPGWKEATLGKVCKFQGGSQPPKADFSSVQQEGYVRLIQIRDYKSEDKKVFIPKEKAKRSCTKDDVMIGRYGPPLFQILRGLEGSYNVALIKATPTHPWLTKEFLFYFLRNRNILNYIVAASSRAAGQIGLNKKTIEPYPISFPAPDEQSVIVKKIAEAETQTQNLEALYRLKLSSLKELKQSLLQKAFSGELTGTTAQEAVKVA